MARPNAAKPKSPRVSKRRIGLALLFVAAGVAAVLAYRRGAGAPVSLTRLVRPGDAAGFNLLLVTLDTVRSDRLGCYGYGPAETPTIDTLAARGIQVDHAVTPMPLTLPSHATMLTGLYPPRHGVRGNGNFHLAPRHVTLTETLKSRGYDTAAFIGSFVLDERFGLDQGFDTYDFEVAPEGFYPDNVDMNRRPAGAVSDAAIQWLRNRQQTGTAAPFFVWVHYFDAHIPYQSPLGALPRFAGRPYDAEIAYVDRELKRLVDELERLDLRARTLIALVSDHGEGLGEHDEPTHGLLLYGSTVRVAFVLSNPVLFEERVRVGDRLVSLVDLRPTLEDLLGLPLTRGVPRRGTDRERIDGLRPLPHVKGLAPPPVLDGTSLLRAKRDPDRTVYIETQVPFHAGRCSPLYGLQRLRDKYIRAPEPEYYDLLADPGELNNLYRPRSAVVATLDARLTGLMNRWAAEPAVDGRRAISEEERDRLAALGYAHTVPAVRPDELPDPKAMLRANRKIGAALRMLKARRMADALRLSRQAVRECKAFADASVLLATIYERMGRPDEAVTVLRESLEINPKCRTALQLARLLLVLRRYDRMDEALEVAASLEPGNGFIYILRGDRCAAQGRLSDAIEQYGQALRIDEHRVGKLARPQIEKLRKAMREASGG
jgi:arylsulfatase A-like enzyme